MGLREAVVLAKVGDLLWVLLVLDFLHDLEPVGHLFAVALFDSGEVGLARRIFRHGVMLATTFAPKMARGTSHSSLRSATGQSKQVYLQ